MELSQTDAIERVWRAFLDSDSLRTSGQKVGMCRWFQVFVSLRRLFNDWSSLLVVLIRANIDEPWMRSQVFGGGMTEPVDLDASVPGIGERRVQTKCSVIEEIRQLRKAIRNAMHFTVTFLSTPLHRRMCGLVVKLTLSVQEWYHAQATVLKSGEASREWIVKQLGGSFWDPLRKTFGQCRDLSILEDLGFKTHLAPAELLLCKNDASMCDDEFMAAHFGKFMQALVKRRIFRSAWLLFGWPGRLGLLLDATKAGFFFHTPPLVYGDGGVCFVFRGLPSCKAVQSSRGLARKSRKRLGLAGRD